MATVAAHGDGTTDDYQAFRNAIESFPQLVAYGDPNTSSSRGGIVLVPRGKFRLSQTLVINRAVRLVGTQGSHNSPATILLFDAGVHGVLITQTGTGTAQDPLKAGLGAVIENIEIRSTFLQNTYTGNGVTTTYSFPAFTITKANQVVVQLDGLTKKITTDYTVNVGAGTVTFTSAPGNGIVIALIKAAHGLAATRAFSCRNINIKGFGGDGLHIQSAYHTGGVDDEDDRTQGDEFFVEGTGSKGNANSSCLHNISTITLGRDAVHVTGGDSQAGIVVNLIAQGAGRYGVFDNSALGNTYVNALTESNRRGAVKVLSAAGNTTFFGGDLNEGNGTDSIAIGTLFINCDPGELNFRTGYRPSVHVKSTLGVKHNGNVYGESRGGTKVVHNFLGLDGVTQVAQRFVAPADLNSEIEWRYQDTTPAWALFDATTQILRVYPFTHGTLPGRMVFDRGHIEARTTPTYGASVAINAALGNAFAVTVTDANAFTIANPTAGGTGQVITVMLRNASGGAMGVVTWGTSYKLAAWTNPANGQSRSVSFLYDGSNWVEISRTPNDAPN